MKKDSRKYTDAYLARCALIKAIAAYDAAGMPALLEVRGNLITAGLYLALFKEPPEGYKDDEPVDGPEDWFGVL